MVPTSLTRPSRLLFNIDAATTAHDNEPRTPAREEFSLGDSDLDELLQNYDAIEHSVIQNAHTAIVSVDEEADAARRLQR